MNENAPVWADAHQEVEQHQHRRALDNVATSDRNVALKSAHPWIE